MITRIAVLGKRIAATLFGRGSDSVAQRGQFGAHAFAPTPETARLVDGDQSSIRLLSGAQGGEPSAPESAEGTTLPPLVLVRGLWVLPPMDPRVLGITGPRFYRIADSVRLASSNNTITPSCGVKATEVAS